MSALNFIPPLLASMGLAYASFMKKKDWITIAFAIWMVLFVLAFVINKP